MVPAYTRKAPFDSEMTCSYSLDSSVMLGYLQRSGEPGGRTATDQACTFSVPLPTSAGGRSHNETWVGCIVSLTTPTRSLLTASRFVLSLSLAPKASNVFVASYLRL